MRFDDKAALPLLILLVLVGVGILILGWIVIALTTKTLITVVLLGAGLYLLFKPQSLAGMGAQARLYVPFGLILLAILFYVGVFSAWI